MFRRISLSTVFGALVLTTIGFESVEARKHVISVGTGDVTTYSPSDTSLGEYYTMSLQIPASIRERDVEAAWLEFYVDAQSRPRTFYSAIDSTEKTHIRNTPVIEVFALNGDFSGQLDSTQLGTTTQRVRPLVLGQDRLVRVEITSVIRSFIRDPSTNHGLIIGSLTGTRDGKFGLRTDKYSNGTAAQIRIHLSDSPGW